MMKAIFDRIHSAKKFPFSELLSAIHRVMENPLGQPVTIRRIGGVGSLIWAYESQLDEGGDVVVPFSDIQCLAESEASCPDEFWGTMGTTHFGISDSSLLFVQCRDKAAELKIAAGFESVRDIPDITLPPTPDSPPQAPRG